MKKPRSSSKSVAKDSDIKRAIGGQPENDRDARDAGLSSATSARGAERKTGRSATRTARSSAKAGKKR